MSKIIAKVVKIYGKNDLHVIHFEHNKIPLAMMSLELENIKENDNVLLNVKSTSVGIAKNFTGDFSYSNILNSKIIKLTQGELLTRIKLEISPNNFIESVITTLSSKRLDLEVGDSVSAFIKASDLSICKILK